MRKLADDLFEETSHSVPTPPTRESSFSFSSGSPFSSPGQVIHDLPAAAPPRAEPPAQLVTFASIRKLRERCPTVDMRTCKEALRLHGSDIDLAAAFLQGEAVAPAASQDAEAAAAAATPSQAAVLRGTVDASAAVLPATTPSPAPSTAPVEAPARDVASLCALLATVASVVAVPATEDAPGSAVPATEGAPISDAPALGEPPATSWPGFDAATDAGGAPSSSARASRRGTSRSAPRGARAGMP